MIVNSKVSCQRRREVGRWRLTDGCSYFSTDSIGSKSQLLLLASSSFFLLIISPGPFSYCCSGFHVQTATVHQKQLKQMTDAPNGHWPWLLHRFLRGILHPTPIHEIWMKFRPFVAVVHPFPVWTLPCHVEAIACY